MSCHPAKLYALLVNNAYFTNGGTPPEPWVVLPVDGGADPVSGFQASAYFNPQTGQLVVAYAGTDPGQSGDIEATPQFSTVLNWNFRHNFHDEEEVVP